MLAITCEYPKLELDLPTFQFVGFVYRTLVDEYSSTIWQIVFECLML
jgi:hypothetical protein